MPEEKPKAAPATPPSAFELVKEIKLPTIVLAADVDPKSEHIFAACLDGFIYEVEIESGKKRTLAKHESYASGVRHLKNSQTLISSGYDGQLIWIDLKTDKPIRTVQAHKFWSWEMDVSADEKLVGTCTGQYLSGGYKYEPAPETEPGVKVFDALTGELKWAFSHVPPVLSLAFSPDSKFLAAANMMGEIRIWDLATGKLATSWTTPDFTSWGIIKSHHYIGGIYDLSFSPDGNDLIACGMGPMNDPMAGNGQQRWQRFAWKENPPRKLSQIKDDDRGNGLMETLRFHPAKSVFLMAGRLAQGKWNAAAFDSSGALLHSLDSKMRNTDSVFLNDGSRLLLAGGTSQEKQKDGMYPEFGRLKIYKCAV